MAERKHLGHVPGLDGLRGLAVVLVMGAHAEIPWLPNGGGVGVTLFFVLSGFLITSLAVGEPRFDARAFYARRAVRLFPALAVVLVVASPTLTADQIASVTLYFGNWVRAAGDDLGILNHTWSLAIEEQFYIVWPIVLLTAGKRALHVAAAGAVVAVTWRTLAWDGPHDTPFVYFATVTRVDAILAGCALGFIQLRRRWVWPATAALLALAAVESEWFIYKIGFTATTVASVVAVASVIDKRTMFDHPVMRWFGRRSYGLYLWHTMLTFHFGPTGGYRVLVFLLAVAVAEVSWRLVERPAVRLLRPTAAQTMRGDIKFHRSVT